MNDLNFSFIYLCIYLFYLISYFGGGGGSIDVLVGHCKS